MEKLNHYRKLVEDVLKKHFHPVSSIPGVEDQLVCDRERDHYQILRVGWKGLEDPVYHTIIHLDIKDGKIWIQRDFTEIGVANELVALGVPKEDIVLAFYAPFMREDTGFAAA